MDWSSISLNPFNKTEEDKDVKKKKAVEQKPESIDIYADKNTNTKKTNDVSLVSQKALEEDADMGLGIQKTTKSVQSDVTKEVKDKVKTNEKKTYTPEKGQVFNDEFIIKNYGHGLTKEKWNKMSPDEQNKVAGKFMNDMITNYNNDPKNKAKGLKSSVVHQYELYMKRCKTPEDVERLTRTCKYLDTDRQLDAFIKAHQYENPEFQKIAQNILAEDVADMDQSVQEKAHAYIKENFNEDAQAVAVRKVGAMQDVEAQNRVLGAYRELKNEKVDLSISDNIGTYFKDKDGKVKEEYPLNLFNDLFQNGATEKVKENTARNTYQLTKDNQNVASDTVMASNNEAYINAMAENAYYFHEDNVDAIINKLENSGFDSTKEVLQNSKNRYESGQGPTSSEVYSSKNKPSNESSKVETSKKETVSKEETKTTSNVSTSTAHIDKIVLNKALNTNQKAQQIKALNKNDKTVAIGKMVSTATIPEIKGLVLSGLKSEVLDYLLSNYSPSNKGKLESIEYLMNSSETMRYKEILDKFDKSEEKHNFNNFFIK